MRNNFLIVTKCELKACVSIKNVYRLWSFDINCHFLEAALKTKPKKTHKSKQVILTRERRFPQMS